MGGTVTFFDKFYRLKKILRLGLLGFVLQGCMLTASDLDPNAVSAVNTGLCGLRFVRNCDGLLPVYDDGTSDSAPKNIACHDRTLEATCSELTQDDGEGPYTFWVPIAVTCPESYESTKISSPGALINISFTCLKK